MSSQKRGWLSKPYSGVTGFVGMPGSGKTYGLIEVANRVLKQKKMPLYANEGFTIDGCENYISDWEQFVTIDGPATIVWDELPLFFQAKKWQEFPDGFLYKLAQIRHDSLRLYYSTIDEHLIDINLRRITFWWWRCRPVTARILVRRLYPQDAYRSRDGKPFRKEWVIVRKAIADMYNTEGKVVLPDRIVRNLSAEQQALLRNGVPLEPVVDETATGLTVVKSRFALPEEGAV